MKKKLTFDYLNESTECTKCFDRDDRNSIANRLTAMCSYLGIFILIPLLFSEDSKYVIFHLKQGGKLFIVSCIATILSTLVMCGIYPLIGNVFIRIFICSFIVLIFLMLIKNTIFGIVNSLCGYAKTLPFIDKLIDKF